MSTAPVLDPVVIAIVLMWREQVAQATERAILELRRQGVEHDVLLRELQTPRRGGVAR